MLTPLLLHALAVTDVAPPGAAPPPRGELYADVSLAGGASDWSGDPVGYGALKLGLRLFGVVTPFVQGRAGYGSVDQRSLLFLSIGVEGGYLLNERFYPRGFVAFVHQHEESIAAVADHPIEASLGIGGGIRHRAGLQMGLGFDIVVHRAARFDITVGPEAAAVYLTYSSGPSWYGLLGAVGAMHFQVF